MSVIIPTRNRAAVLAECLRSLAVQLADKPVEVIVVDNASEDGTAAVGEEWSRRNRRFRYIREERIGLSAAKNAGIAAARGRLLVFTDDDVLLEPGWIEGYEGFFSGRADRRVIAGGPVLPIPADLTWPDWLQEGSTLGLPLLDHGKERALEPFEHIWGANLAAPAEAFSILGGFDDALGRRGDERGTYEDVEFADRARSRGYEIWFCPKARIFHRIGRERLAPRKILGAAFAAGTMDHWRRHHGDDGGGTGRPRVRLGRAALLGVRLSAWVAWSLAFRIRPRSVTFDRARRSAWRAGWALQELTGTPGTEPASPARRVAFAARRLALAITPELPA